MVRAFVFFHAQVISLLDPSKEEILKSVDLFCKMLETPSDKGTAHHTGVYGMSILLLLAYFA